MKEGSPFGLAGIWENWKDAASGDWIWTFAIITTDSNELVAEVHDRIPVIIAPGDYACWLGDEPDPRDLMRPFPAGLMRMWPISTRVNKPENDDRSIVEPIEVAAGIAQKKRQLDPGFLAIMRANVLPPPPSRLEIYSSFFDQRFALRLLDLLGKPCERRRSFFQQRNLPAAFLP